MKQKMTELENKTPMINFKISGALVLSTDEMKAQINCFGKEMDVHLDELQPEGLRSLSGLKSSVELIKKLSLELNKRKISCSVFYEGQKILIVGEHSRNRLIRGLLGNYIKVTNTRKILKMMRLLKWF